MTKGRKAGAAGSRFDAQASPLQRFLDTVIQWASTGSSVQALILVGSHARGTAGPLSDVDLIILAQGPERFLDDTSWARLFGRVEREELEHWGAVTSLRVHYAGGREVEFGWSTPEWVRHPLDPGTQRVLADGFQVLFDRHGILNSLASG